MHSDNMNRCKNHFSARPVRRRPARPSPRERKAPGRSPSGRRIVFLLLAAWWAGGASVLASAQGTIHQDAERKLVTLADGQGQLAAWPRPPLPSARTPSPSPALSLGRRAARFARPGNLRFRRMALCGGSRGNTRPMPLWKTPPSRNGISAACPPGPGGCSMTEEWSGTNI